MSLFGSLMGDLDDDPFFGGHMRQMNSMMNRMSSVFNHQPFGGLLGAPAGGNELMPFGHDMGGMRGTMMPFGFPNMNRLFQFNQMGNDPHCHSYSSSTVMTMTNGPDGRPQVYQASQSVRAGPGGVKETKKAVADSRTGVKKMAIGHHIGERAHIMEKEQNMHSGALEEHQEYINLDEEEADEFNQEWQQKTRQLASHNALTYGRVGGSRRGREQYHALPALPSSASSSGHSRLLASRQPIRRSLQQQPARSSRSTSDENITAQPERSRKRDHDESSAEPKQKVLKSSKSSFK